MANNAFAYVKRKNATQKSLIKFSQWIALPMRLLVASEIKLDFLDAKTGKDFPFSINRSLTRLCSWWAW